MLFQRRGVVQGLMAVCVAGLLAGCSTAPKKPVGAHARAEKGAPTIPGGMGTGDVDPLGPRDITGQQIPINQMPGADQYNLCQMIHFDYDKSNIKPEYEGCLQRLAEFLKAYPDVRLVIEGHTDERGTNEYNLALGERRAESASAYLYNLGIGAGRVVTRSWGEERPIELCSEERCWRVNRRAEFFGVQQ